MTHKHRRCFTLLRVAMLASVVVAIWSPPAASSPSVRVVQFNVMGQIGNFQQTDYNRGAIVSYVTNLAQTESPLAISLNEVCPTQVFYTILQINGDYTQNYGIGFRRPWEQRFNNCAFPNSSTVEHGNAIFMAFDPIDIPAPLYYSGGAGPSPNATCLSTAVYLNSFTGCATHFSSPPTSNEMNGLGFLLSLPSATYRFGLGDLNEARDDLPTLYRSSWREADRCPLPALCSDKQVTADRGSRIDYIYSMRANTSAGTNSCSDPIGVNNACIVAVGFSDHHVIRGFYQLN